MLNPATEALTAVSTDVPLTVLNPMDLLAGSDPEGVSLLTALNPTESMGLLAAPDLSWAVLNLAKSMAMAAPDPTP